MKNIDLDTRYISFSNLRVSGSLFVVFDTEAGPIFIGYGAVEGDLQSGYLFFGKTI